MNAGARGPVNAGARGTEEPRSTPPQKLAALGRVAVSVSPSGLLFPYYLGVFRALDELELLEGAVLAGSSGGALMGAFVCSGLSVAQAETATKSLYSAVMQAVKRQDLLEMLREVLQVRAQPASTVSVCGCHRQSSPRGTERTVAQPRSQSAGARCYRRSSRRTRTYGPAGAWPSP